MALRIFLLRYLLQAIVIAEGRMERQRLISDIFNGYNADLVPVQDLTDKVEMRVFFYAKILISFDEGRDGLELIAGLDLTWYDRFLMWEPERYGDLQYLHLPKEKLWTPTLMIQPAIDLNFMPAKEEIIELGSSGWVAWNRLVHAKFICPPSKRDAINGSLPVQHTCPVYVTHQSEGNRLNITKAFTLTHARPSRCVELTGATAEKTNRYSQNNFNFVFNFTVSCS